MILIEKIAVGLTLIRADGTELKMERSHFLNAVNYHKCDLNNPELTSHIELLGMEIFGQKAWVKDLCFM